MFADADHDRHPQDGRILVGFEFERDIDKESLQQYRHTLASLQPTHPWVGISDMDFLKNPHVKNGYEDLKALLTRTGYEYGVYLWNPEYNGLDDYVWKCCLQGGKSSQ